ncbi:MAG: hypothetical protein J3Q66DRAFT_322387 [Benniella sp.]|nr:MAG: hypothetical protein J3Q66DRAFT_322387 [Benniella sp.]
MLKTTFIAFVFCCLSVLSLVNAQGGCGPQNGNQACAAPNCCSSSGFCGTGPEYCTNCQPSFGAPCQGGDSPTSAATSAATEAPPTTLPAVVTTTTDVIPTTAATTLTLPAVSPSSSTRGTFQLQPTGRPSGTAPSQDKDIKSRLALIVVVLVAFFVV